MKEIKKKIIVFRCILDLPKRRFSITNKKKSSFSFLLLFLLFFFLVYLSFSHIVPIVDFRLMRFYIYYFSISFVHLQPFNCESLSCKRFKHKILENFLSILINCAFDTHIPYTFVLCVTFDHFYMRKFVKSKMVKDFFSQQKSIGLLFHLIIFLTHGQHLQTEVK